MATNLSCWSLMFINSAKSSGTNKCWPADCYNFNTLTARWISVICRPTYITSLSCVCSDGNDELHNIISLGQPPFIWTNEWPSESMNDCSDGTCLARAKLFSVVSRAGQNWSINSWRLCSFPVQFKKLARLTNRMIIMTIIIIISSIRRAFLFLLQHESFYIVAAHKQQLAWEWEMYGLQTLVFFAAIGRSYYTTASSTSKVPTYAQAANEPFAKQNG